MTTGASARRVPFREPQPAGCDLVFCAARGGPRATFRTTTAGGPASHDPARGAGGGGPGRDDAARRRRLHGRRALLGRGAGGGGPRPRGGDRSRGVRHRGAAGDRPAGVAGGGRRGRRGCSARGPAGSGPRVSPDGADDRGHGSGGVAAHRPPPARRGDSAGLGVRADLSSRSAAVLRFLRAARVAPGDGAHAADRDHHRARQPVQPGGGLGAGLRCRTGAAARSDRLGLGHHRRPDAAAPRAAGSRASSARAGARPVRPRGAASRAGVADPPARPADRRPARARDRRASASLPS